VAWIEYTWIEYTWIEYTWIEYTWIEYTCIEYTWTEYTWHILLFARLYNLIYSVFSSHVFNYVFLEKKTKADT